MGAIILGAALVFQGYAIVTQIETHSLLPPQFGNFPANRVFLEEQTEKDEFAFAVVGDTKSVGTFERITEDLKRRPLDFVVLLGDCSYNGREEDHRYFRAECATEYAMPFPVFYVVGNHDVSPDGFPIGRFEQTYGPSIFSFEYQQCLFIVLRILDPPFSNEESIRFLRRFTEVPREKYRHRFVFMHIPPPVSSDFIAEKFIPVPRSNDLEDRFEKLAIVEVWPWMAQHRALTILLDLLGLMILLMILKPDILPMFRKGAESKSV
jgi:hypothetical protein